MFSNSGHNEFEEQLYEDSLEGLGRMTLKEKIEIQLKYFNKHAFNPHSIIEHEKNQLLQRTDGDEFRHDWETLEKRIKRAEETFKSGEINSIASSFYYLGLISAKLDQEKVDHIEINKLLIDSKIRKLNNIPFERKAAIFQFIQETAVGYASHCWQSPEHSAKRIGQMAQLTKDYIATVFSDSETLSSLSSFGTTIPRDINTYKKWLRSIAPASAQKRGAPKK